LTARILVVDDEAGMRRSLAIVLRRDGYEVTEASSVADAIGQIKAEDHSLVIADLMMEPLNGLDLLSLMRQYRPGCPVIIITAFGSPEARTEAFSLGAVAFIEKPVELSDLLARIRQVLHADTA
jgi:two-component system, NtrC family, response regulator AtoC